MEISQATLFEEPGSFLKNKLRILTGKKQPKIRKWTFESLVHQINSFLRGSKTETNFRKK